MSPLFFATQNDFRRWLEKNSSTTPELMVGYYKVGSGKPSMTWSESVDQALCFGWIDGVRKSIDHESYCIRFTPRKSTSIWSDVNIAKVEDLTKRGLMQPSGLARFAERREHKSRVYTFENTEMSLSPEFERQFQTHKKAWEYFEKLAPGYRKSSIHWIMSAKQESTRAKRLQELIQASEMDSNPWKDSKHKQ